MKLVRFGEPGRERPGLIDNAGRIRDISGHISDIGGKALLPDYLTAIRRASPGNLPIVDPGVRIGPCVAGVGKIIGVGLNYPDFVAVNEMHRLEDPLLFLKAPSAISGPNDDIVLAAGSTRTDWEIELAVVIGIPGHGIDVDAALDHVAGYCIVNDVSERDYVFTSSGDRSWLVNDWVRGKNYDTFAPLGPWLVTPDEMDDPLALDLWLDVDGLRRQSGNTEN
ncbi:MAG: fumarylacetoacetate hydrolase family protein, partial [Alphaproteobacteria bacterium]|nr:fumarylacetoacetate hydrolase family protein [Alphaproteobacteria bacterium]